MQLFDYKNHIIGDHYAIQGKHSTWSTQGQDFLNTSGSLSDKRYHTQDGRSGHHCEETYTSHPLYSLQN